jgi:hypothetical protein
MGNTEKPKGITNKDIEKAISLEIQEFIEENRDLILKRAKKRLKEEFRR